MSDDEDDDPRPARTRREPLWQRLAVGLLAGVIATIAALPTWLAYALGTLLAVPWWLYWSLRDRRGRRSSGYWRNVRIAFRDGTPLGVHRPPGHLWRWSQHIAWILVDFCRMTRLSPENVRAHCDLEEYPALQAAFAEDKGLICATGHVGVWDVAGTVAGLLGMPITSVFRPSPLPALDRLIERLRTRTGQTVVARKKVMFTLKRLLAERKVIGILGDGGGKHSSVVAPFLGTDSRTVATPAVLHLLTGAPIAVLAVLRTGPMRYRLRVYDVIHHAPTGDREADLVAIMSRVNRGLSQAIVEAPEQWFWQSRRFRHRPPGEVPGEDGLPPLAAAQRAHASPH
ncbi:MAG: lysophospholipid acyltransferase family protein [Planctomycetes bacterium]|nr:lysophospholipid acyltransferase family protein [Planctomycetota bacterium]